MRRTSRTALAFGLCLCTSSSQLPTLVILNDFGVQDTHSRFFALLEANGHRLEFTTPEQAVGTSPLAPTSRRYAGAVVFSDLRPPFTARVLLAFLDSGGDVFYAVPEVSNAAQEFGFGIGFELDEPDTLVVDYIHGDKGDPTLVSSRRVLASSAIAARPTPADAPIFFRGTAMALATASDDMMAVNKLSLPLLTAESTAFSCDWPPLEEINNYPLAVGKSTILVGGLQARNNARVMMTGSLELLGDELLRRSDAGNARFAKSIAQWTFRRTAVLKRSDPFHYKMSEDRRSTCCSADGYTEGDTLVYSVTIQENQNGSIILPLTDAEVYVDLVQITSLSRIHLIQNGSTFSANVTLPKGKVGAFRLILGCRKEGHSFVSHTMTIVARPARDSTIIKQQFELLPIQIAAIINAAAFLAFVATWTANHKIS